MDNSLFQFQPLRWDSVIYPQEHFAYIRPSCWCCSLAQKDILNFFTLHQKHSHPHHAIVWCRPCFDGELARNCWAVPALLGMMAGGRDTPIQGFPRVFCCWRYKETLGVQPVAPLPLLQRALWVSAAQVGLPLVLPNLPISARGQVLRAQGKLRTFAFPCYGGGSCLGI